MWHALSTSSYGNWRIWFHSCINLLFVLYPVRHSLFRDVVILCHRSIGTSPCQSPSEFCTSHEMFLFWVFSSMSPPCSDVEVFWRGGEVVFVFFLQCLNFKCLCIRIFRSQTFKCPTSADLLCPGEWKMVPLIEWTHLPESQLNNLFSPA